jgi:orotidine-5'-phosphate decarboxylase
VRSASRPPGRQLSAARRRLIFALDVETAAEAIDLVDLLIGEVGLFKIGKQLFVAAGPDIVRRIRERGGAVFLDLKFHDIPQTVASAGAAAARLGVVMLTVHTAGGPAMLERCMAAVRAESRRARLPRPHVLGVTVLTSLSAADLRILGVADDVERQALRLARLARGAGLDGVIASPHETPRLRRACGARFLIVTPGVRMPGERRDDQKRTMDPAAAIRAGADYLVVGRPIREAPDPIAAARAVVAGIADGLARAGQKRRRS